MREKQSKAIQERHSRMLNELLKLPGNDCCADCKAKNPRWASYSLGLFLCIRCASLHRKMGTHISKVKSVSLDCWSKEDIENMRNLGGNNARNSEINTNPSRYCLPVSLDDDSAMEKYIREKWEKKLYMQRQNIKQLSMSSTLSSTSSLDELPTPTATSSTTSINPTIITSTNHTMLTSFAGQSNPFSVSSPTSMVKNSFNPFNTNVTQAYTSSNIETNYSNNPFNAATRNINTNPFRQ